MEIHGTQWKDLSLLLFAGLTIMGTYEAELATMVAAQQELTNAEKLLDLPVTVCPEIIDMQKDMKGLRQIYDVYKAQEVRYNGRQLKRYHCEYYLSF